jgi:hypothetical protein
VPALGLAADPRLRASSQPVARSTTRTSEPRKESRHGMDVDKMTTPYGDYCDIWNPETHEFPDLDFLRLIDMHLMEASERRDDDMPEEPRQVAPHLFDILRIDEIPDCLDGDRDALGALDLLGSALSAFQESSYDDLPSVFAVVEQVRKKLSALLERKK